MCSAPKAPNPPPQPPPPKAGDVPVLRIADKRTASRPKATGINSLLIGLNQPAGTGLNLN